MEASTNVRGVPATNQPPVAFLYMTASDNLAPERKFKIEQLVECGHV